ncbi:TetR/AcrR family transcriptional regulator [Nocardia otitidiscaviarum]|uniref:TetR/AcrR family transcriptional regulator n=1 Tax=Nocardia otitidiscaviarum TaxID=1823 RepID=A0A516NFZ2_9NOCA|nr:TetR/AcrR family transcriptional regulator [Nocardia otitidiscaviarum]MCP9623162.1 TetR/AcrR family transcriptional regulator [Nocardia otitidiscaviarum]QDP77815.1 TetR/AcrR family transcriptional regulator [Nocardia otitidiscaviarum]
MSTAGTKGVPRAEREQAILDAAVAEIGRVGYAGLSPVEVAQRAGISKPLVYTYFQSKDNLYIACVNRAAAILAEAIEGAVTAGSDPAMAQRTLDALFVALEPRPHDWTVLFDRSHPETGPAAEAVRTARREIAAQAARGVADALRATDLTDPMDLSALTDVWMGTVTSLVLWWQRHPEQTAAQMSARSRRLIAALVAAATD